MHPLFKFAFAGSLLAVTLGCGKGAGGKTKIEVKNFSDRAITVLHLSGLVHPISKMELKPARIITTETPQQEIPDNITVTWRYDTGARSSGSKRSKLSLHAIPKSERKGKFVLEFTKENQWNVRFEPSGP